MSNKIIQWLPLSFLMQFLSQKMLSSSTSCSHELQYDGNRCATEYMGKISTHFLDPDINLDNVGAFNQYLKDLPLESYNWYTFWSDRQTTDILYCNALLPIDTKLNGNCLCQLQYICGTTTAPTAIPTAPTTDAPTTTSLSITTKQIPSKPILNTNMIMTPFGSTKIDSNRFNNTNMKLGTMVITVICILGFIACILCVCIIVKTLKNVCCLKSKPVIDVAQILAHDKQIEGQQEGINMSQIEVNVNYIDFQNEGGGEGE